MDSVLFQVQFLKRWRDELTRLTPQMHMLYSCNILHEWFMHIAVDCLTQTPFLIPTTHKLAPTPPRHSNSAARACERRNWGCDESHLSNWILGKTIYSLTRHKDGKMNNCIYIIFYIYVSQRKSHWL